MGISTISMVIFITGGYWPSVRSSHDLCFNICMIYSGRRWKISSSWAMNPFPLQDEWVIPMRQRFQVATYAGLLIQVYTRLWQKYEGKWWIKVKSARCLQPMKGLKLHKWEFNQDVDLGANEWLVSFETICLYYIPTNGMMIHSF